MKNAKTLVFLLILCALSLLLCSCTGKGDDTGITNSGVSMGGSFRGDAGEDSSVADGVSPDDSDEGSESEDTESTKNDTVTRPAGLITAGAFNDNDNYDFFKTLFDQGENAGKFNTFTGAESWGFDSFKRIAVTVKNGDASVSGARVRAEDNNGNVVFEAVTDSNGIAYLFTHENSGIIKVSAAEYTAESTFSNESRNITVSLDGSNEKKNIIDIMFVVDITGSMGDELEFLQTEIDDVISRVVEKHNGAVINLALLFYRDSCDTEEFAYYDFKNVTDPNQLAAQKAALNNQRASGGGDTPESVDEALEIAMSKQWSTAATTKLIFHVLDAPPHSDIEGRERYLNSVKAAARLGIRICPIICSGADDLTEYLARQAALYTGGTFIFVTDDSGIGNPHHKPSVENVTVEALNSMLVRLISGYHSGTFDAPVDWRQEVTK